MGAMGMGEADQYATTCALGAVLLLAQLQFEQAKVDSLSTHYELITDS